MVTRCVSTLGSKESGKAAPRSRESWCRRSRGVRKRCRIRAGWRHEWIPRSGLPPSSVLAIHEVVRGPFSSPLLVGASPYVLISSYSKNSTPGARCPKIRRGIPDPWAEYLAYRGFCGKEEQKSVRHDLELGCKNIYVTATVWKNLGLPLGQGIPDPWKIPERRSSKSCRKDRTQRCECCRGRQSSSPLASKTKNLQRCVNLSAQESPSQSCGKVRKPINCTAPCNPDRRSRPPSAVIASAPPLTVTNNEQSFRTSLTIFPRQVKRDVDSPDKESFVASTTLEINQDETLTKELPRKISSPKNSKAVEVQTSSIIVPPFPQPTRCFCHREKSTSCHCDLRRSIKPGDVICGIEPRTHPPVKNATCSCNAHDFWQKQVDFEPYYDNGKQKLNVTRLACGCVHISPGIVASGFHGSEKGGGNVGHAGVASPPESAFHGGSIGQKPNEFPLRESIIPKPKMMSRMRQLLNHCKPRGKPQHKTGDNQDKESRIPEDAKLVCCQCSCPYLKVKNSSKEEPAKTPGRKKRRCGCERCVAKRERREKRHNNIREAAVEDKEALVDSRRPEKKHPRSSLGDQTEPKIMIKCHSGNPGNLGGSCSRCKVRTYDSSEDLQGATRNSDDKDPRKVRNKDIINEEKLRSFPEVKRPCGEMRVLEAPQCPTSFGAPWYSSDSGENADVSDTSKHMMQCVGTLGAAPETSLVTSCTFISRINHKSVLECLKRQQRRGRREETRLRLSSQGAQDPGSRSFAGKKSSYRSDRRQTLTPTSTILGYREPKNGENHIPFLDIKESAINESEPLALPRATFIDPATSLASSFYKDEQTSGSTHPLRGDKKKKSLVEREKSRRKENSELEFDSPNACSSQTTLDAGSTPGYNRFPHLAAQRSYLELQKARLGADDETENSTYVCRDEHNMSGAFGEAKKFENSQSDGAKLIAAKFPNPNLAHEPVITTIISPRRISTNSSTTGNPESSTKKSREAHAPANSLTNAYSSSENKGLLTLGRKSLEVWHEPPFTFVPCPAKFPTLGSQAICSRAKVNGFLEGEEPGSLDSSIAKERALHLRSSNVTPLEFPGDELDEKSFFTKGVQREMERRTSTDNKCLLKYCSLRRSEGNGVPGVMERELPVGRKAFSSSGNQRTTVLLPFQPPHGENLACVSPRPLIKIQDRINVG